MNIPQTIKSLPQLCETNLKALHESTCDEYRRRLCEMWEVDYDETFWIAESHEELVFSDWVMLLPEVRYCVEHGVTYDQFREYWTFVEDEIHQGRPRPRINFRSWFRGLRPEMLKENDPKTKESTENEDYR